MRATIAAVAMLALSAFACNSDLNVPGSLHADFTGMSSAQFDTAVNSINWVDGYTRYRCTSAACTDTVPVEIKANDSSFEIDSLNPGAHGILVARVRNQGSDTTYMYHFRPAPYRYYFLVKRPDGGPTRWVLLEHNAGSAPDSVAGGPFAGCGHPAATSARADFRTCADTSSVAARPPGMVSFASYSSESATARYRQTTAIEAGAWIGCAYGCCPLALSGY